MKVISGQKGLVAEGVYQAVIEALIQKGRWRFWRCRIAAGEAEGRDLDYLIPKYVPSDSPTHAFLVSVLGSLEVGEDVDPKLVVGEACLVRVKHIHKERRVFANVIAVSPAERVGNRTGKTRHRRQRPEARD